MRNLFYGAAAFALIASGAAVANYYPSYPFQAITALTGNESWVMDLNVTPVTPGALQSGIGNPTLLANFARTVVNDRTANSIVGGDFGLNSWARGTTFATLSSFTPVYTANNWAFFDANTSSGNISKQTTNLPQGSSAVLQFQRTAADTHQSTMCIAQEIGSGTVTPLQGLPVSAEAMLLAGANFSAFSGNVTFKFFTGTGVNEGLSALIGGTWTGQALTAQFTQKPTVNWANYNNMTFTLPSGATELALEICWLPQGTAGAADFFQLQDVQFEQGSTSGAFAKIPGWMESEHERSYYQQFNETAGGLIANGMISSTNNETINIPLSTTMRSSPTVTVTAGGFAFNIAGTNTAVGGGFAAGTTAQQSQSQIAVVGTVTATAGQATQLVGTTTTGKITVSSDF